jgi:predicted nucleic acid-binding Zn ribbon protein
MAEGKKPSLTPLKDIISALLGSAGPAFNSEDANLWRAWDEVAGATISGNAQPLWIKNGLLRVKVSDPIWLQELSFMEENMRNKLNEKLGRKAVEKIEFRLRSR